MEGSATGQSSAAAAQPDPAENQVKDLPPEKFDSDRDARMRFFHDVAVTQLSERYNAPIDSLERAAWTQARALAVLSWLRRDEATYHLLDGGFLVPAAYYLTGP